MGEFRRARCLECGDTFLMERGKEHEGRCPNCGAAHYVYRVLVKWSGRSQSDDWRQRTLEELG